MAFLCAIHILLRLKSPVFLSVVERFLLRDCCLEFVPEVLSAGVSWPEDTSAATGTRKKCKEFTALNGAYKTVCVIWNVTVNFMVMVNER